MNQNGSLSKLLYPVKRLPGRSFSEGWWGGRKPAALWLVGFCVLVALLLSPSTGFSDDEADRALALVRKTYASLTGLTAIFVQTEERPGVGITTREEGGLSFSPPDRMRWDYGGEQPHQVVINASRVWIYTPSRNQIILRQMAPEEMRKGAATFLGGLDGVEKDFSVQSRPTDPGKSIPLDLFPLEDNLPYNKISLLVTPDSGLIERIAIHHKLGNVTTISFHGFKTNVKLDNELFDWKVPDGVDVIEP
jgi:outer membrane lipoprotein carrier protein